MTTTQIAGNLAKLHALRAHLNSTLPERDEQIEGLILSLLSGENMVLLGPPGTAKSLAARMLTKALGLTYYETLLSRFTTPPEVFGPMSLKGLENDEVRFQTARMLPEAEVAFLDEIFKAGTALLNTLLPLINERTFFHGTLGPQPTPLRFVIGASNEMPQGDGLEALWDRFLLRYEVKYVTSKASFSQVVLSEQRLEDTACPVTLTRDDVNQASAAAAALPIPKNTVDAMFECRQALATEGIVASDRRWKKSLKVARAAAFLAGNAEVDPSDLLILQHSLWMDTKQRSKVLRTLTKILDSDIHTMTEVVDAARECLKAYLASPQGVKESASFGKQLRAMKEKAEGLSKKAPEKRRQAMAPMVGEITESWRQVIRLAAEATGVTV